jgi:AhpD family alkylhydroperoxidase
VIADFRSQHIGRITLETPEQFGAGSRPASRPTPNARRARRSCARTGTSARNASPRPTSATPKPIPRVKAVFDDIRATRKTDFINNLWRYLAFDPPLLEQTWAEVKALMATPTTLDPLTKEMVYIAVSIVNGCSYCVHSHTAAATAKGMTMRTARRAAGHRGAGGQDQPAGHGAAGAGGPGVRLGFGLGVGVGPGGVGVEFAVDQQRVGISPHPSRGRWCGGC